MSQTHMQTVSIHVSRLDVPYDILRTVYGEMHKLQKRTHTILLWLRGWIQYIYPMQTLFRGWICMCIVQQIQKSNAGSAETPHMYMQI